MKIRFTKMTGAGNDFVVIDDRAGRIANGRSLARRLCDRRWGIGADGLLLLRKSRRAAYKMMYYNADGSYGGMCGNGGRCAARFAALSGLAGPQHSFEALDYVYEALVAPDTVTLRMKDPSRLQINIPLRVQGQHLLVHFIDTGAPHVVLPVQTLGGGKRGLDHVDVISLGRAIRWHRRFAPKGANVNFVEVQRNKRLRIRTYERGVENETLACGTGSIAGAVVGSVVLGLRPPVAVVPRSGSILKVGFLRADSVISDVTLRGAAEIVFIGEISVE